MEGYLLTIRIMIKSTTLIVLLLLVAAGCNPDKSDQIREDKAYNTPEAAEAAKRNGSMPTQAQDLVSKVAPPGATTK